MDPGPSTTGLGEMEWTFRKLAVATQEELTLDNPFLSIDRFTVTGVNQFGLRPTKPEREDPQKLIPLQEKGSHLNKQFMGTQWQMGQFFVTFANGDSKTIPLDCHHSAVGANVRVKVMGGNVARKIRFDLSFTNDPDPTLEHTAYLEFDPHSDISSYICVDHVVRESRPDKGKKQKQAQKDKKESYFVIKFKTTGGTGYGLDYESSEFDDETKTLFSYGRQLAKNFDSDGSVKMVIVRVNASHSIYENDIQVSKKQEKFNVFRDCFENFSKDTSLAYHYYRTKGEGRRPETIFNSFATRKTIADGCGLTHYPAKVSFASLHEAAIILIYGACLEHQRELEICHGIGKATHQVAFVDLLGSRVLAIVKLTQSESQPLRIKEGTLAKIEFRPRNSDRTGSRSCFGLSMANVLNLPYGADCLFIVHRENIPLVSNFSVEVGSRLQYMPASIISKIPSKGVQRQVDSINRLCDLAPGGEHTAKWRQSLLNQHAGKKDDVDPTDCLDLSKELVDAVVEGFVNDSRFDWSDEQKACLRACRAFPGGILLIQGFPGAGKTFTIVTLGKLFNLLGIHVIYSTPTHYAGDAIAETIDKFDATAGTKTSVIRIYRPGSEEQAFKPSVIRNSDKPYNGIDDRNVHKSSEDAEKEAPDAPKNTEAEIPRESTSNADESGDDFLRRFSEDAALTMFSLVKEFEEHNYSKSYGLPEKSLEAAVIRRAYNNSGEKLIGNYPSEDQVNLSKGMVTLEDLCGDVELGRDVDFFEEVRRYHELMKEDKLSLWSDEDKRNARFSFTKVAHLVVEEAKMIITTNNNAGSALISSHFGKAAKGIIIFRDEDWKETEVNSWIPVCNSQYGEKIQGIVMSGDRMQLKPTVISAREDPCFNEFASQMETSFFDRLIHMKHPVYKLTCQRRFRDTFKEFLNYRVYNDELRSHPSVNDQTVNPVWDRVVRNMLRVDDLDFDSGYFVASIENAVCEIEESTKSRYNTAHVRFVVNLIMENFNAKGYDGKDITIITYYRAQVRRYLQYFLQLAKSGDFPREFHPYVCTVDSMQGKESKVVILDWVISRADTSGDLGFTMDNHRGNVAQSRMREVMVNVLPADVGNGTLSVRLSDRTNSLRDRVQPKLPYPCAFMQWARSKTIVVYVQGETCPCTPLSPLSSYCNNQG
ncbi:hypothetical protein EMCG_09141 [[Emmonsia] crescens]|uniref:DNA2/NAM7 helicase-like C-terminal domain-containing protein n=1 Tax=[Emmonsia] crescens TaxID=73230 RepID=A0A0G2I432_9EURO|nr:hypothetical protein EMCG_09141 [Emmonsia crescens UAMH 3008]